MDVDNVPFDRDIHVGDVVQNEVDERLVSFFAEKFDKRLRLQRFTHPVCYEPIFCEPKIEIFDDLGAQLEQPVILNN